jgi:putative redox protein
MVEIQAELTEGMRVSLSNGRHTWLSDEPAEKGGDDTGPTPYELLLGSLASCTLITLVMYARRKGIDLRGVTARYEHAKVPAPHGQTGVVDQLTGYVSIDGEYDDPVKERLEQIVSRCPVHRTIENGALVVDKVEFV